MSEGLGWVKGHGTENDFLLLSDPDGSHHGELDPALVAALCHRRRGIGADGVLRAIRSESYADPAARASAGEAEWFMDYRNADGSIAQTCGNGLRVFARYLVEEGLVDAAVPVPIATRAGVRTVRFRPDGQLSADMGYAELRDPVKVTVGGRTWPAVRVDVGNPHAVVLVDDLADAGALSEPPGYDAADFPHGVNVEFVARLGTGRLGMRVYERGVGETRSCGTGACAAAAAHGGQGTWQVDVLGGRLEVAVDADGALELTGPAELVAAGDFRWTPGGQVG